MWILIFWVYIGSGAGGVGHPEFLSQSTCMEAKRILEEKEKYIKATCVKK